MTKIKEKETEIGPYFKKWRPMKKAKEEKEEVFGPNGLE